MEGVSVGLIKTLNLPIELDNGNYGRTTHFGRSASRRKKYEKIIRSIYGQQTPLGIQVDVVVRRILGPKQRFWDSSSVLRGNWKEIEDALVACGFFVDDAPPYIRLTLGTQAKPDDGSQPRTEVELYDAGQIQWSVN